MIPALYLLTVVACGLLASKFRLPPLVGFLAAGFILGASPLPVMGVVHLLGDLGVAVLLFTIGLKIDLRVLVRREVAVTALLMLVLLSALNALVIGAIITLGVTVGEIGAGGVLALGFAFSFSSTVVVVKLLEDRADLNALYGRIAVGVLVIQDLAAVLYMSVVAGEIPVWWSPALVLVWPLSRLLRLGLEQIEPREMRTLYGIAVALLPGFYLFHLAGIDGNLGALIMGALFASHPQAKDLANRLFTIKELLLVGFFVDIGLHGLPGVEAIVLAACLLALTPLRVAGYTLLIRLLRLRRRTSVLTGLAMASYSEFALIVVAASTEHGQLGPNWTVAVSLVLALSFVLSAVLNRTPAGLSRWMAHLLPHRPVDRLHPEEKPLDLTGVCTVVFGMGRLGQATYLRLCADGERGVLGIDNDPELVAQLQQQGMNVLDADVTDQDFWLRLDKVHAQKAVLALPGVGTNTRVFEWLNRSTFEGYVIAVARSDQDAEKLREEGVDAVINMFDGVGDTLARTVERIGLPQCECE